MKKTMLGLMIAASLYACGDGAGGESGAPKKAAKKDVTQDPVYIAGQDLVAKNGCLTCHKVDEASTGPAYKAVAAKYPNNAETYENLSLKIIKGGYGNWGQVPMTPHPELSQEDATKMVKYIMLLK